MDAGFEKQGGSLMSLERNRLKKGLGECILFVLLDCSFVVLCYYSFLTEKRVYGRSHRPLRPVKEDRRVVFVVRGRLLSEGGTYVVGFSDTP